MPLSYWTPEQFRQQTWKSEGFLWAPYIPAGGTALLHGPGGASKSQLLWQLLNAVQIGGELFGQRVKKGNALLICVDMEPPILTTRFRASGFQHSFDIVGGHPIDVSRDQWRETQEYHLMKKLGEEKEFALVALDAVGKTHGGSANDNRTPIAVFSAFRELFPDSAIVFNHHDKKPTRDPYGRQSLITDHDAMGSANWRNFVVNVMHLYPLTEGVLRLDYTKSQVSRGVPPLELYRYPDTGRLALWDYPTWRHVGWWLDNLLLNVNRPTFNTKEDAIGLWQALRGNKDFEELTVLHLQDFWEGWKLAKRYEIDHPAVVHAGYVNGKDHHVV